MQKSPKPDVLITGAGVVTSNAQGKSEFLTALLKGVTNFGIMKRPGRQFDFCTDNLEKYSSAFIGAEITAMRLPELLPAGVVRAASLSSQAALIALSEAWMEAALHDVDPEKIGLIIGGSNFQQRELIQTQRAYNNREQFLRPTYGMTFMDSDMSGICSEVFGFKAFSYTLGAASASSQVAVIEAAKKISTGQVDVCIVLGALMDLSCWELQAFRSMGAMGSIKYENEPDLASRPFDMNRDGFIFGESCAAVVLESEQHAKKRNVGALARVAGYAIRMDGNRNPNPSLAGESAVIKSSLENAGFSPKSIGYINPHGTGSVVGDEIELMALKENGLSNAYINATKSVIGHGLASAGVVELVATVLQLKEKKFHPAVNLDNPIDRSFNWVTSEMSDNSIQRAITLSMGFGGVNTAICVES